MKRSSGALEALSLPANAVLDRLMLGVVILDCDARVSFWNCWMSRCSTTLAAQARGRPFAELFDGEVNPQVNTAIRATLNQAHSRVLTHAVHGQLLPLKGPIDRHGQRAPMALNLYLQPLRDPANPDVGCLIQIFDVTGPVNRERKLEQEVYQNRRSSLVDELTGQLNRRAFEQWLGAEWRRQNLVDEPVACLMVDVDQFKMYNDILGHVEGDRCLRGVAHAMARRINRPGDALFRFGGEEFAVLLTTTDKRGASIVAQSLLETVRDLNIQHPVTKAPVTISIGLMAGRPASSAASPDDYVMAADQALYEAKRAGRNCYRVHSSAQSTGVDLSLAGRQAKIVDRELMQ